MPEADRRGIEVEATVIETLPNALYRVELADDARTRVAAHVGSPALLRLLPGDRVVVALLPFDMGRGRIVRRAV